MSECLLPARVVESAVTVTVDGVLFLQPEVGALYPVWDAEVTVRWFPDVVDDGGVSVEAGGVRCDFDLDALEAGEGSLARLEELNPGLVATLRGLVPHAPWR